LSLIEREFLAAANALTVPNIASSEYIEYELLFG
jgi:hypothetical protein